MECDEDTGRFDVIRGSVRVLCNLGTETDTREICACERLLLASDSGIVHSDGKLFLPPDSVAILRS